MPVVARLVGNGFDAACTVLGEEGIKVVTDLDAAVTRVREHLREAGA